MRSPRLGRTTASSFQLSNRAGQVLEIETESGREKSGRHHAAALDDQLGFSAQQERTDFQHPARRGEAHWHSERVAEHVHHGAVGQRTRRSQVHRPAELRGDEKLDCAAEVAFVNPGDILLAACQRICRVATTPVSVDIERGYGRDAKDVGTLVDALIQLGVVGINIEDGTDPTTRILAHPSILTQRIASARAMARHHGLPLFINARIDTHVAAGTEAAARLEETRQRALAYIDAGADGIFVPGLSNLDDIGQLAHALPVPLNVYAGYPGAPGVEALQRVGARRISLGCGPMQAVMAHLARISAEAFTDGRYDTMGSNMLTAAQANALFNSSR